MNIIQGVSDLFGKFDVFYFVYYNQFNFKVPTKLNF